MGLMNSVPLHRVWASGLSGKDSACQCWRPGFDLWVGKTAWRRKRLPAPVYLPGNLHGQRSLEGYIPWGGRRVSHNWATKRQAQGPMPKKNDNRDVVTWSYSLTEAIRSGWSNTRSSLWSPAHSTQFRWHHTFQLAAAASNLEAKPDHWKDFFLPQSLPHLSIPQSDSRKNSSSSS